MECPFCLHKKTEVYNSRPTRRGTVIWRRRRCTACGKTFTTQEHFDPSGVWKVKTAKKTMPYARATLAMSILQACDHRTNQDDAAWYLYETVEKTLAAQAATTQTITTQQIIDATSTVLRRFDAAAYIKYLSYHHAGLDAKVLRARLRRKA